MAGGVPTYSGSPPARIGVRRRAFICFLAGSLALSDWDWLPSIDLRGEPRIISTGVTINGVRINLVCHGRGDSSVIIVKNTVVTRSIDDSVQAELARYVRVCTLAVVESASHHGTPGFASTLPGLLISGNVPGPYVIIAHASQSTASEWVAGPLSQQVIGFVLIDPPGQPTSLLVPVNGDQRPLPLGDRDDTVLELLSLFWPPDDQ